MYAFNEVSSVKPWHLFSLEMWEDQELHSKSIMEIGEQEGNFYNKEYGKIYT